MLVSTAITAPITMIKYIFFMLKVVTYQTITNGAEALPSAPPIEKIDIAVCFFLKGIFPTYPAAFG